MLEGAKAPTEVAEKATITAAENFMIEDTEKIVIAICFERN